MNPVRTHVAHSLAPGLEFSHGTLQLPAAVANVPVAVPRHVVAPREQHSAQTLIPADIRPMAALLPDLGVWDALPEDATPMDPHEVLRQFYGHELFKTVIAARADRNVSGPVARAADVVAAASPGELAAVKGAAASLGEINQVASLDAPALLGRPAVRSSSETGSGSTGQSSGPRSIRVVDTTLGVITVPRRDDARTSLTHRPSVSAAASVPPPVKLKNLRQHLINRQADALVYYATDEELDASVPDTGGSMPPQAFPMLQQLLSEYAPAWRNRHGLAREAAQHMPRVSIERVSKHYLDTMRLPPNLDKGERPCVNGQSCRCHILARREGRPQWGYAVREFLLPSQLEAWNSRRAAGLSVSVANDGPAGPCIECTLYAWTVAVSVKERRRDPVMHPINTFHVEVRKGEYARGAVLPSEVDGFPTGIEDYVPVYDTAYRQFEPTQGDRAILREVGVDFRPRLSQMEDACLGVPKARPLARVNGAAMAPLCPARLALGDPALVPCSHPAWTRFVQSLPVGVLADRAMVLSPEHTASFQAERVPVIWLRRHLEERLGTTSWLANCVPLVQQGLATVLGCASVANLPDALRSLATHGFSTFERAVSFVADADASGALVTGIVALLTDGEASRRAGRWATQHLFHEMRGLVTPPGPAPSLLWRATLWRIGVSLLFARVICPWPPGTESTLGATFVRMARYVCHTHLDYLTAMTMRVIAGRRVDDAWWLALVSADSAPGASCPFADVYPQANRVCCAEELPGLTPSLVSVNPWFDTPARKQVGALHTGLTHMWRKRRNNPCAKRGAGKIQTESMATAPAIARLVVLQLRCTLLGNLPGALAPLPLAAAVRVNATFAPRAAILAGRRAAALAYDKATPCSEAIYAWIRSHPMLTTSLIREHDFFTMELSGVSDDVASYSRLWPNFKALARHSNAQMRRELVAQLLGPDATSTTPMNWHVLEQFDAVASKTVGGEVQRWHTKLKEHNGKLGKGLAEEIMQRKMTAEEGKFRFDTDAVLAFMQEGGRLEAVHVCAWLAARQVQVPLPDGRYRMPLSTGALRALGMSRAAFDDVRQWLHLFHNYNVADDSFKRLVQRMYARRWQDYVLLKTYLRLHEYYQDDVLGFTSVEQTLAVTHALRTSLDIPPWVSTPPRLGYLYYCEGCLRPANTVVQPSRELMGMPPLSGTSGAATDDDPSAPVPLTTTRARKKKLPPRPWPAKPIGLADGRAGCVDQARYHPLEGTLHCVWCDLTLDASRSANGGAGGDVASDQTEGDISGHSNSSVDEDEAALFDGQAAQQHQHRDNADTDEAADVSRLLFGNFSCQAPLVSVDLVGVYKRLQHKLLGRCVYCGHVCEVLSVNMTNRGLSCGEHALVDEYPRWHRLWRHIVHPQSASANAPRPRGELWSHVRCSICRDKDEGQCAPVTVYDAEHCLATLALCRYHMQHCRSLVQRHSRIPVRLMDVIKLTRARGGGLATLLAPDPKRSTVRV